MAAGYPKKACPAEINSLSLSEMEDLAATKRPFKDPEGIEGRIEVDEYNAVYPYAHKVRTVYFRPTKKGQQSAAYQKRRREMGDDWSTFLRDNRGGGSDSEVWAKYLSRALRCTPR